jgi:hypothetical protein
MVFEQDKGFDSTVLEKDGWSAGRAPNGVAANNDRTLAGTSPCHSALASPLSLSLSRSFT